MLTTLETSIPNCCEILARPRDIYPSPKTTLEGGITDVFFCREIMNIDSHLVIQLHDVYSSKEISYIIGTSKWLKKTHKNV